MNLSKGCRIEECSFIIGQDNDSNDESDLGQTLDISITNAGAGNYLILKTDRWAIDDVDDFCDMLKGMVRDLK